MMHEYRNPIMWQATETGSVNGVSGNVDIDFQYQDFSSRIAANTWRTIGGETWYYQNYVMQKNVWINDGTGWFYMNSVGHPATGWFTDKGTTYYLAASTGRMATGWMNLSDSWYYFNGSGAMKTGWIKDNGAWYYTNASGVMQTGWLEDAGARYYLRESGAMSVGWRQLDGTWYYFDGSGAMKTGWIGSDDTAWYYLDPVSGRMYASTQITVNGITYDVNADGACTAIVPETIAETTAEAAAETTAEAATETAADTTTTIPQVAPFPG
jgi:glucan-binding YG repeat protein